MAGAVSNMAPAISFLGRCYHNNAGGAKPKDHPSPTIGLPAIFMILSILTHFVHAVSLRALASASSFIVGRDYRQEFAYLEL